MRRILYICMIAVSVLVFVPWEEAGAVVGRPASPGSVAGVRRRTRRRTVAVTTAAATTTTAPAAATTAAVAYGTRVNTLPTGCATIIQGNVTYYNCGGTFYQPQTSGTEVVYVVVEEPQAQ